MITALETALRLRPIQDMLVVGAALFILGLWPGPVRFGRSLLEPTDADVMAVKAPRGPRVELLPPLEWDEDELWARREERRIRRIREGLSRLAGSRGPRRPAIR